MHDLVCHPCNQDFGDTIDRVLTRDSVEALLRFQFGIKSASKADEVPYVRITLKMNQPGPWFGAQFEFESDALGINLIPAPLPQVAFRWKAESEWRWILERNLVGPAIEEYRRAIPTSLDVKVVGPTKDDVQRLAEKLEAVGIDYKVSGSIDAPVIEDGAIYTEVRSQLDSSVARAIAKIAFNYVACVHGPQFILRSDFDRLRNYIRFGLPTPWPIVDPTGDPILALDSRLYRQTNGHIITFDWNLSQRGLLAQVSLFNHMTYRVLFCPWYSGIWFQSIRCGHHFDFEDGIISPLASVSRALVLAAG